MTIRHRGPEVITSSTPLKNFTEDVYITCSDRRNDIGLTINTKEEDHETVKFKKLTIQNTRVGLIKLGNGTVRIDELVIREFGGDALNIRGSNLWIGKLNVYNCKPTRPYNSIITNDKRVYPCGLSDDSKKSLVRRLKKMLSECGEQISTKYIKQLCWKKTTHEGKTTYASDHDHIDAGLQAYYGDPDDTSSRSRRGKVENIEIEEVKIYVDNPVAQVFALTEGSHYENFKIGRKSLDVSCAYKYWFIANTLVNSEIGNKDAIILCSHMDNHKLISEKVRSNNWYYYKAPGAPPKTPALCDGYPKIRIGTGVKQEHPCLKEAFKSESFTKNVNLIGVGFRDDSLPSNPEKNIVPPGKKSGRNIVSFLHQRDPSTACPLRHFKNSTLEQNLRLGDKDNIDGVSQVGELQRFLNELGHKTGYIDRDFGNRTKEAVEAFQRENFRVSDGKPLQVDGVIGNNTLASINTYCN